MKAEPPSSSRGALGNVIDRVRELITGRSPNDGNIRAALEDLFDEENEADSASNDGLSESERELLRNALSFGELEVSDVMVPRSDIKAVDIESSLGEVVSAMQRAGHTRMIVFRESLDDVAGMVHLKDLLPYWGDGETFSLEGLVRDVLPVPVSMRVIDLLLRMRATSTHMAIVVDEFGGTDGLVTIEDVVEEIVGEIQDEHDRIDPQSLVENEDGSFDADARIKLEDLEERLGTELLDEERREYVQTLGGLLSALLERIPSRGETVEHEPSGVAFEVLEADPRRIRRVRIRRLAPADAATETEAT
ncbi:hemolysin family protein [Marinivivus vitaminiproducens]|uniref:hemolysin family protein n=1 Tax=Marinivivus vitaminiproducens TaxID=3035935 RepID=UPI00279E0403|nr:hemolysin family protein [Geminicoccaceae bacterium SCSIO 64248]